MTTFLRVIGEGLSAYTRLIAGTLSDTAARLIVVGFRLLLFLTMILGVICLVLAIATGAWAAWHAALIMWFYNALLIVCLYVFNQARSGRFSRAPEIVHIAPRS